MDVDLDGVAFDLLAPAVEPLLEFRPGQWHPWLFKQRLQQGKLTRRQRYRQTVLRQLMGCRIHAQVADGNLRIGAASVTAQHRAHAGRKFIEVEGFDEVIVGTAIQPRDAVGNRIAGRDDEHRNTIGAAPQPAEKVEAGLAGQPEVEQQDLVRRSGERQFGGLAIAHPVDTVAVLSQALLDALADHQVVFYEQYTHRDSLAVKDSRNGRYQGRAWDNRGFYAARENSGQQEARCFFSATLAVDSAGATFLATNPTPADMNPDLKNDQKNAAVIGRILSGARWATVLRIFAQVVSWICTIVVVRFISNGDYGLNAMLETPLGFLLLLSTFGLDNALVRAKTLAHDELRSAFGWLLMINGLLFLAYFFGSPLIAAYFKEPRLELLAQVLALVFLLIPFRVIPDALLDRDLKFKLKAFAELVASVTAAITTLTLAVMGFGVWALIAGVLSNRVLLAIILMVLQPWFVAPSLKFQSVRGMMAFGGTMALAGAVANTGNMLPVLVAGPSLGTEALGIFVVSMEFALLPLAKIMPVIHPIVFPAFSKFQEQPAAVARYLEKSVGIAALILLPLMIGLACVAEEFVLAILGEKWLAAIVPLALLSLSVPFRGLTSFFRQTLGAIGYAGLALKSALLSLLLLLTLILVGVNYGVIGVVLAVLVSEPIVTLLTVHWGKQAIATSFRGIARSLRPALVCTAGMALAVVGVKVLVADEPVLIRLGAEVGAGMIAYLAILQGCFSHQLRSALELLRR
jgi:O-antigen/teichoic acid export membrane protein